MNRWVVAYDIPDDRRRTRLAKALEGYGDRVQDSVFEVALPNDNLLERLKYEVLKEISPAEDLVRLYPLCSSCGEKVLDLGLVARKPFDEPDVVIV